MVHTEMSFDFVCYRFSPSILAKKWVNLEQIATKVFFADFTPTRPRPLEHHIKMYQKLLKIMVLKHRVFAPAWK